MAASLAGLAALAAISARGCLISIATSPAGPDPCPCRSDRVRPALKHQIPRPQSAARPLCITGRGRLRPAPGRISPDAELSALSHRPDWLRSEEHTSELQSLMRISYAVFCLKKKNNQTVIHSNRTTNNNI